MCSCLFKINLFLLGSHKDILLCFLLTALKLFLTHRPLMPLWSLFFNEIFVDSNAILRNNLETLYWGTVQKLCPVSPIITLCKIIVVFTTRILTWILILLRFFHLYLGSCMYLCVWVRLLNSIQFYPLGRFMYPPSPSRYWIVLPSLQGSFKLPFIITPISL